MTSEPTVFIVDDDAAYRESLSVLLQSTGRRTRTFASAAEFIEHFDPDAPGCITLDVRMPGVGGLELQERLIRQPGCPPIVFLTGYAEVPAVLKALRQGAVEVLQKTCEEEELLVVVEQAIESDAHQRIPSRGASLVESPRSRVAPIRLPSTAHRRRHDAWRQPVSARTALGRQCGRRRAILLGR